MCDNFVGQVLSGRYEIRELLGEGKTASVFAAHDNLLDRQVAVKVVRAEYALPPDAAEEFIEKLCSIAKLSHPHILRIYDLDVGTIDDVPRLYLVMQFARGGSLADCLDAGTLGLDEVERILQQVCAALDYARSQEILHLDLKPANILVGEQGNVMVADFGLANLIQDTAYFRGDAESTVHDYVSPEQLSDGQAGPFSDVYALGIILYEMLTEELPKREWTSEGFLVHLYHPLPARIQSVIEQATQPDPDQRYCTAGELANAFTAAIDRSARAPRSQDMGIDTGERLPSPLEEPEQAPSAGKRAEAQTPAEDRAGKRRSPFDMLARRWKEIIAAIGLIVAAVSCVGTVIMVPEVRRVLHLEPLATPSVPTVANQTATPTATPTLTPLAIPTATPSPTATPIPYLTVTDERLDVYTGPGKSYHVLGQAEKGDRLLILGRSEDGRWWQVDYLGWSGWVAAQSAVADVSPLALRMVEAPPTPINRPPVVQEIGIASMIIEAWGAMSVTCKASDPDDDELRYTWEASDGFIVGEGDAVTYDAPEITGSQTITVTVQDERGSKTEHPIQVQIVLAQSPPGTFEPYGIFGQIWREHLEPHRRLGWANEEERVTDGAHQFFERGVMFWRKDTDEIYVITRGGDWQVYTDTWEEGMKECSCPDVAPPQAKYIPIRGFGKVWCEQLGASNAKIGWATTREQPYEAHWQAFERGLMCQGLDGSIYAFYEDGSWQSYAYPFNEGTSTLPPPLAKRNH